MVKKLIVLSAVLAAAVLINPAKSLADDTQTCTQVTQYGGAISYICGAHTPVVETGIADNLPMVGSSFVGASAILAYFSRKIKKTA